MKTDQWLRVIGIVATVAAYLGRLFAVGNGPVIIFGYETAPLGVVAIVVLLLAAPETVDRLPFGPSRD
jgi:hypothetical protein